MNMHKQDRFLPRNFQFIICYILLFYSVQSKLMTALLTKWSRGLFKTPNVVGSQAYVAMYIRSSLLCGVMQSILVVIYRSFGSFKGKAVWDCLTFKMGPIGCSKTCVTNYQSTLPNIPEERRSQTNSGSVSQEIRTILWRRSRFKQ
jgi:hypothetical protein